MLHSTAQLYSHKRKHERRDFESAYRKFREDQHDKGGNLQAQGIAQGTVAPSMVTPLSNIALMNNQTSMALPVSIKREALDDFDSFDAKRFKSDHPTMSLPLSIKQEPMEDSESNDSKFMQDQPDNFNENSFSDMKSESSESMVGMDTSNQDVDSDSFRDDASDVPDILYPEQKPTNLSVLDLSGDKLGDSLTLPIPNIYYQDESPKVTLPQEVITSQSQGPHPIDIPTSSSSPVPQPMPVITTIPLPARPPIMDKREKDEAWKNYLIR